jgi:hypothetical protein
MKIKRQDQTETSKTTAFWLYEFAYDLEKQAKNVDYLKEYLDKNYKKQNKFNTIAEKLAYYKEVIGFDLAQKITNEIEKTSSTEKQAGDCGCKKNCKKCPSTCNCKKSDPCDCAVKTASVNSSEDIQIMEGVLKYIRDMIKDQPHVDVIVVLNACKCIDKYHKISKRVDEKKLMNYINELLQSGRTGGEMISYVPLGQESMDQENRIADYANHAEPHKQ